MVVVLPDPLVPTKSVTRGGAAGCGESGCRDDEQLRDPGGQEGSNGLDAGRPLAAEGAPGGLHDGPGGGGAQVGGEQRFLEFVQRGVVDRARR